MSLTVDQINNKQFNTKMRGYNPKEVQEFIQEVSQTVQQLKLKIIIYKSKYGLTIARLSTLLT